MNRTAKAFFTGALLLIAVPSLMAQEAEIPKGAKALFGQGNEEIFYPRQGGGSSGSQDMNPSSGVDDNVLTSFYKKPDFPGIAYSLEVIRRGESHITTVADPRQYEFRTGDRVRLRLVPNFTGHTYVLEAKGAQASLVYPASFGTAENVITAGRESYVPAEGWLKLVDPAEPFTMRVLFKPGQVDYRLNQPNQNPAVTRVSLTEAVNREWRTTVGQKGMVFESDRSYVGAGGPIGAAGADAGMGSAPAAKSGEPYLLDESSYTTNYVVVNRRVEETSQVQQAAGGQRAHAPAGGGTTYLAGAPAYDDQEGDAIAIEVPIRHVRR